MRDRGTGTAGAMPRPTDWEPLTYFGDPVPGVPEAIDALILRYESLYAAIDELLARLITASLGSNTTETGDAIYKQSNVAYRDLLSVRNRFREAADALTVYQRNLRPAQEHTARARVEAKELERRAKAHRAAIKAAEARLEEVKDAHYGDGAVGGEHLQQIERIHRDMAEDSRRLHAALERLHLLQQRAIVERDMHQNAGTRAAGSLESISTACRVQGSWVGEALVPGLREILTDFRHQRQEATMDAGTVALATVILGSVAGKLLNEAMGDPIHEMRTNWANEALVTTVLYFTGDATAKDLVNLAPLISDDEHGLYTLDDAKEFVDKVVPEEHHSAIPTTLLVASKAYLAAPALNPALKGFAHGLDNTFAVTGKASDQRYVLGRDVSKTAPIRNANITNNPNVAAYKAEYDKVKEFRDAAPSLRDKKGKIKKPGELVAEAVNETGDMVEDEVKGRIKDRLKDERDAALDEYYGRSPNDDGGANSEPQNIGPYNEGFIPDKYEVPAPSEAIEEFVDEAIEQTKPKDGHGSEVPSTPGTSGGGGGGGGGSWGASDDTKDEKNERGIEVPSTPGTSGGGGGGGGGSWGASDDTKDEYKITEWLERANTYVEEHPEDLQIGLPEDFGKIPGRVIRLS